MNGQRFLPERVGIPLAQLRKLNFGRIQASLSIGRQGRERGQEERNLAHRI